MQPRPTDEIALARALGDSREFIQTSLRGALWAVVVVPFLGWLVGALFAYLLLPSKPTLLQIILLGLPGVLSMPLGLFLLIVAWNLVRAPYYQRNDARRALVNVSRNFQKHLSEREAEWMQQITDLEEDIKALKDTRPEAEVQILQPGDWVGLRVLNRGPIGTFEARSKLVGLGYPDAWWRVRWADSDSAGCPIQKDAHATLILAKKFLISFEFPSAGPISGFIIREEWKLPISHAGEGFQLYLELSLTSDPELRREFRRTYRLLSQDGETLHLEEAPA